jgi:hypothetical protein
MTGYIVHLLRIERCDDTFLADQLEQFLVASISCLTRTSRETTTRLHFIWDPVYSMLEVVASDDARSYDETHVFKMRIDPWDAEVRLIEDELLSQQKWDEVWIRFTDLLRSTSAQPHLTLLLEQLRERGIVPSLRQTDEEVTPLPFPL